MKNHYDIQILPDSTSQAAVRRIKHKTFAAPYKRFTAGLLLSAIAATLLAATFTGSMLTAQTAKADVLTDMVCVKADADNGGKWGDVNERLGSLLGSTAAMKDVKQNAKPNVVTNPSATTVTGAVKFKLTALEKYGAGYPRFETWTPAVGGDKYTFAGVDSSAGLGTGETIRAGSTNGSKPVTANNSSLVANNLGSCTNLLGNVETAVANTITLLPQFLITVSQSTYSSGTAVSLTNTASPLNGFMKSVDSLISGQGGLRDSFFIPFLLPVIILGACYVGYMGIVKRAAWKAVQSTGWMIAAVALGVVFLSQPTALAHAGDTGMDKVQAILNSAVPISVKGDDMCDATGANASMREANCVVWKASVYDVWAQGQFGSYANDATDPRHILNNSAYPIVYGNKSVTASTWPQFELDRQATGRALQSSETAYAQLSGNGVAASVGGNSVFAGGQFSQVAAAITMCFTVTIHVAVPWFMAFMQLLYQLFMLVLLTLTPFILLFGIIPNWGRRIVFRYAEIFAGLLVKRVLTAAVLSIYFWLYAMVVAGNGSILGETMLVMVLGVATLVGRNQLLRMTTQGINFGGNKSIGLPGAKAAGAAATVAAIVGGGILGGGIGAIAGGVATSSARKDAKDVAGNGKPEIFGAPTANAKTPTQKSEPAQAVNTAVKAGKTVQQAHKAVKGSPAPNAKAAPVTPTITTAAAPETVQPSAPAAPVTAPTQNSPAAGSQPFPKPAAHQEAPRVAPQVKTAEKGSQSVLPEVVGKAAGATAAATGVGVVASGAINAVASEATRAVQPKKREQE